MDISTYKYYCRLFANVKPNYIVECGNMLGGSAIKMAQQEQDILFVLIHLQVM